LTNWLISGVLHYISIDEELIESVQNTGISICSSALLVHSSEEVNRVIGLSHGVVNTSGDVFTFWVKFLEI
jgi:hypothetical protein